MQKIIVWFRNDLRVHDHPALAAAAADGDYVIPLFIFDDRLLQGKLASSNRNRFLLESLQDLKTSLQSIGADIVIRRGNPETVLPGLASETGASAVYYTIDYTPFSLQRDKAVTAQLNSEGISFRSFPGRLALSDVTKLHSKTGTPYKVFTPFWKNWQQIERREVVPPPHKLSLPTGLKIGSLPLLKAITNKADLSPNVLPGGETAGRRRLKIYLTNKVATYNQTHNDMAADNTSRLSAYLHFGCLSVREIETMLPDSEGAQAWHRQLAWRDFYHYIIYNFPANSELEFQEKYRQLRWDNQTALLSAWQHGQTGYPIVDAAMRQLRQEGWMHNRARLIVGSFLSKDLWIDWRLGEAYFRQMLIDGDKANNNGNWQWIASVGVDPAPVYRRLYNPTSQLASYDPTGAYVHRYVPELKEVPDRYLAEPWVMPKEVQQQAHCIIGKDYPKPIIDHKQARLQALEHYRSISRSDTK